MEKVRERLNEFLAVVDLTKRRFQKDIGVSPAYFANAVNGFSPRVQYKIRKAHPELNLEWLMTGEGNMFAEGYGAKDNKGNEEENPIHEDSPIGDKNDERLISIITSQQSSIRKAQEQIDRLLDLLEKEVGKVEKKENP